MCLHWSFLRTKTNKLILHKKREQQQQQQQLNGSSSICCSNNKRRRRGKSCSIPHLHFATIHLLQHSLSLRAYHDTPLSQSSSLSSSSSSPFVSTSRINATTKCSATTRVSTIIVPLDRLRWIGTPSSVSSYSSCICSYCF
mmetsp:Transcript_38503/g.62569  ORF Transcript_38503/g.62569 Transcript_38503/m.62569 type:complete len:141 (+) Transcript_38503:918-1340(+)